MTHVGLAAKGLKHNWRTNGGVALAIALCTAVLTGALMANSSVTETLSQMSAARLGTIQYSLTAQDRFMGASTAGTVGDRLGRPSAGLLSLWGGAGTGSVRASLVRILGVDDDFFRLAPAPTRIPSPTGNSVYLGRRLASQLDVSPGDEIVLRVHDPEAMPLGAPLSAGTGASLALRVTVARVLSDTEFGSFGLEVHQQPPMNVFLDRDYLSTLLDLRDRINTILIGRLHETDSSSGYIDDDAALSDVNEALGEVFTAADAGLFAREYTDGFEVLSDRIFFDAVLSDIGGDQLLTYFTDSIGLDVSGSKSGSIPYSFVAAVDDPDLTGFAADEIALNRWAAEDLGASIGDPITLRYRVLNQEGELVESAREFKLKKIVSIEDSHRFYLPDFPGIAGAENCRDWDTGFPLDLTLIRDRDEKYWDVYRGSPKGFVTLEAGQAMWSNIYGNATALRFPGSATAADALALLTEPLSPRDLGLTFADIAGLHKRANQGGVDFGQLFIGLSMFLVAAAVFLAVMFSSMSLQSRLPEIKTLSALGLGRNRIGTIYLLEQSLVGLCGGILGIGIGILYNKLIILGLETVWNDAVRLDKIVQKTGVGVVLTGIFFGFFISLVVGFLGLRRLFRIHIRANRNIHHPIGPAQKQGTIRALATVTVLSAVGCVAAAIVLGSQVILFFISGLLLLVSGMSWFSLWLARQGRIAKSFHRVEGLGFRSAARRRASSLTTAVLLAGGLFVVTAVGANKSGSLTDFEDYRSGTGGFFLVGESSVPVTGLPGGVSAVGFRVLDGDDASCLNLNRVEQPRILAVEPLSLTGRFDFVDVREKRDNPWDLLNQQLGPGIVPGIADQTVLSWGLGISLGDDLIYTDEKGREIRVRIVASLENSVFQGNVIISKKSMLNHYPSVAGDRFFLFEPSDDASGTRDDLERRMGTFGLRTELAGERLMEFYSVENTYLTIFMMLGGLGILLGTAGLGIAAARNVAQHRREYGLLLAVGFTGGHIRRLVFTEHAVPLASGVLTGVVSAIVAVIPALLRRGQVPVGFLALVISAICLIGLASIVVSLSRIDRSRLVASLQEE